MTLSINDQRLVINCEERAGQKRRDAPSIVLPQQDADVISHIALDIGGSLIKLVYFSPDVPPPGGEDQAPKPLVDQGAATGGQEVSCTWHCILVFSSERCHARSWCLE